MKKDIRIDRVLEADITADWESQIHRLLVGAFSVYPKDRIYYKQMPAFRYLAFDGDEIVGHLAVEHRMIRVGDQREEIFGLSDLCVEPEFQKHNIASGILECLEDLADKRNIPFLVLSAGEVDFYSKKGFIARENQCRWLFIQDYQTLGVVTRDIPGGLMVKELTERSWPDGLLDFLGHIF